jgi:hypothetical protein
MVTNESGMQFMYKGLSRSGSIIGGSIMVRDCSTCGFRDQYDLTLNCSSWTYAFNSSQMAPIAPDSPANQMAQDLCRR